MTISDFITKHLGHKVDFDGHYGAQCVDLFRQYCKDVWELPHLGGVEGAKDLWERYSSLPLECKYLECILGTKGVTGDVAIWGATSTNKYGHVAIVTGVMSDGNLLVFEQDGFKQDGAKLAIRSNKNLLGFLRKR